MGYLNDTWGEIDHTLTLAECSQVQRRSMRISYYLGIKAMLDAIRDSGDMEIDERAQFITEIAREWRDFQTASTAEAIGATVFGSVMRGVQ